MPPAKLISSSALQRPDINHILAPLNKRQAAAGGGGGANAAVTAAAATYVYAATTVGGVVKTVAQAYVQTFSPAATVANPISAGVIALPTGEAAKAKASDASTTARGGVTFFCATFLLAVVIGLYL